MNNSELSTIILDEIQVSSPNNLEDLVQKLHLKYDIPTEQITDVINSLVENKKIDLHFPIQNNQTFSQFFFSINATWFWIEVLLSTISVASIYFLNDNASPLIYIRNIMGLIFSLYLPGYGFIKAVLPYKEFSQLERNLLSIGSSIALVPFIGLFLNFINKMTVGPILLSIFTITTFFSLVGIIREFNQKK